jgi:hypothetical protein
MIEDITAIEVGGKTAIVGTILVAGYNGVAKYLSLESINPWVLFVTGVVSLLYMGSRWRGQRLKNKGQILLNEQTELENEQLRKLKENRENRHNNDRKEDQ